MQFRKQFRVPAVALVASAGLLAVGVANSAAQAAHKTARPAAAQTVIGVDLTYNNTDFWSAYINYESQYAKQMNIKLLGPDLAGASASTQNQQIEELVNEGAKAIIINPETATSVGPAITYASKHNVKLISVDTIVGVGKVYMVVRASNVLYGQDACAEIASKVKSGYVLDLEGDLLKPAVKIFTALYKCFIETDCSLVEINPLVVTKGGEVMALDAKFNFDDNAMFRHPDILAYRDITEEDPREVEASKFGLSYIGLDGNIACLVNGAGLAMGTMDIIQYAGGKPANFLDVGGGANEQQVTEAFKILVADKNVKAILVNIFGGIMKCDTIAQGIINAVKAVSLPVPLVVRLEGTNVAAGKKLLQESNLPIIAADDLADAAKKVVAAVKK